jgi:type I restriction enzyme S subunit
MIEDLKPYPVYRNCGLPWLGEVPAHWEIKRGKSYLQAIDKRSNSGEEELLTVSSTRGVVPRRSANVTMFKANSYSGHKLCWPGDLVINSLWAWNGGLGVSRHHGIVSTAYGVYRARNTSEVNPYYLHELLRSSAFQWELQVRSKGVWISRLQLTDTAFLDAPIPLPPPEEQAAIARFLVWATNRLDRAIGAKRRIIALLQEQRQAIIHRAVTRGLDPSVPLKDSGIPWLEEIPEHWEVWRISRFAAVGNGSTPSRAEPRFWTGGHYPWLNSSQINRGHIDSSDQFVTPVALRECHLPKVTAGSILVAITGQGKTRGMSAVLETEATISQHLAFISPCRAIASPEFLRLALTAAYPQLRAISDDSGSTKGALTCEDLKRFYLPIPPAEEQTMLINRTQALTGDLLHSISRLECEITLLREYRTRLIADVVTGKLDVREVAAGLPEPQNVKGAQLEPEEEEPEFEAEGIETESMD